MENQTPDNSILNTNNKINIDERAGKYLKHSIF